MSLLLHHSWLRRPIELLVDPEALRNPCLDMLEAIFSHLRTPLPTHVYIFNINNIEISSETTISDALKLSDTIQAVIPDTITLDNTGSSVTHLQVSDHEDKKQGKDASTFNRYSVEFVYKRDEQPLKSEPIQLVVNKNLDVSGDIPDLQWIWPRIEFKIPGDSKDSFIGNASEFYFTYCLIFQKNVKTFKDILQQMSLFKELAVSDSHYNLITTFNSSLKDFAKNHNISSFEEGNESDDDLEKNQTKEKILDKLNRIFQSHDPKFQKMDISLIKESEVLKIFEFDTKSDLENSEKVKALLEEKTKDSNVDANKIEKVPENSNKESTKLPDLTTFESTRNDDSSIVNPDSSGPYQIFKTVAEDFVTFTKPLNKYNKEQFEKTKMFNLVSDVKKAESGDAELDFPEKVTEKIEENLPEPEQIAKDIELQLEEEEESIKEKSIERVEFMGMVEEIGEFKFGDAAGPTKEEIGESGKESKMDDYDDCSDAIELDKSISEEIELENELTKNMEMKIKKNPDVGKVSTPLSSAKTHRLKVIVGSEKHISPSAVPVNEDDDFSLISQERQFRSLRNKTTQSEPLVKDVSLEEVTKKFDNVIQNLDTVKINTKLSVDAPDSDLEVDLAFGKHEPKINLPKKRQVKPVSPSDINVLDSSLSYIFDENSSEDEDHSFKLSQRTTSRTRSVSSSKKKFDVCESPDNTLLSKLNSRHIRGYGKRNKKSAASLIKPSIFTKAMSTKPVPEKKTEKKIDNKIIPQSENLSSRFRMILASRPFNKQKIFDIDHKESILDLSDDASEASSSDVSVVLKEEKPIKRTRPQPAFQKSKKLRSSDVEKGKKVDTVDSESDFEVLNAPPAIKDDSPIVDRLRDRKKQSPIKNTLEKTKTTTKKQVAPKTRSAVIKKAFDNDISEVIDDESDDEPLLVDDYKVKEEVIDDSDFDDDIELLESDSKKSKSQAKANKRIKSSRVSKGKEASSQLDDSDSDSRIIHDIEVPIVRDEKNAGKRRSLVSLVKGKGISIKGKAMQMIVNESEL